MPATPIVLTQAPEMFIKEAHFNKNLFDNMNEAHGYNVILERAMKCPCKSKGSDNLSSCRNCGGSGWIFINPTQTKSIIHSMNRNTQYKEWTEANLGQANFSFRDANRIGFMDRITLLNGISLYNQTIDIKQYGSILFSFLDYEPIDIEDIFLFNGASNKLTLLSSADYIINNYKFILNSSFTSLFNSSGGKITITLSYTHRPQYHIIDINRDTMAAKTIENKIDKGIVDFPISAIGRKAHYVINKNNFEDNLYLDNSYTKDVCRQFLINGVCFNIPINNQPSNPTFGQLIYDSSTNQLKYYNGTTWIILDNLSNNQGAIQYTFTNQTTVSITHGLGRYVDVEILDSTGNEIEGQEDQPNGNTVIITFNTPQSGIIIIS